MYVWAIMFVQMYCILKFTVATIKIWRSKTITRRKHVIKMQYKVRVRVKETRKGRTDNSRQDKTIITSDIY